MEMGALPVGLPARYADGPGDPSARTTAGSSRQPRMPSAAALRG